MSTKTCTSCNAPLSNVLGQKIVECDFCGAEVELKYDTDSNFGKLTDQRFLRLWNRAINSYEKGDFNKCAEIVDSLIDNLLQSNTFTEDLVKVYDLKLSILIDAFITDRNFLGKLDSYISDSITSYGNKYPILTISNFLSGILEKYEDVVDFLPKELQFTFANYCFQEFFYLFGGNLLVYAEESLEKISKQQFTYSQNIACFYYFSFIVKIYYSSIKFIEGVYPKTTNKDEIKIIKNTCITLKKAYSTYLSTSFEKKYKKGDFIDYKIIFSKTNIKDLLSYDGDEFIYEDFFEIVKDFEKKWIPEEAKEIDLEIEQKRLEEEAILEQKRLEEEAILEQKRLEAELMRQERIKKNNARLRKKMNSLKKAIKAILSTPLSIIYPTVIVALPIVLVFIGRQSYISLNREKIDAEKREVFLKDIKSVDWYTTPKEKIRKIEFKNTIGKVDPSQRIKVLPSRRKDVSYKSVSYDSGDYYYGQLLDGERHGQGTYTWSSGDKYYGGWRYGKKHGQGTYHYRNGDKYVGGFINDENHGQGTYNHRNGDKYYGEWRYGKKHGQGTYNYVEGGRYIGEWRYGKKHGQGTMIHSNGDKYLGEYNNDKRHGQGTYTFSSGRTYHSGEWRYGKKYY